MLRTGIPGLYLQKAEGSTRTWAESAGEVKRRHFVVEGQTLKLFGRRGKTYKGQLNLLSVTALRPTSDPTAPPNAFELAVRYSRTKLQTCILVPDHSSDDLFMGLGNALPSHATSEDLWWRHMGSRPAGGSSTEPGKTSEYRVGKTLGSGTFGKARCPLPLATARRRQLRLARGRAASRALAQGDRRAPPLPTPVPSVRPPAPAPYAPRVGSHPPSHRLPPAHSGAALPTRLGR